MCNTTPKIDGVNQSAAPMREFAPVKIQIVQPVPGKSWPVGHTVLMDDERAAELIDEGFAIVHPTVTDPGPTRPCPCEDDEHDGPCEECDEQSEPNELDDEEDTPIENP